MTKLKKVKLTGKYLGTIIFMIIGGLCGYFGASIIEDTVTSKYGFISSIIFIMAIIVLIIATIFLQIIIHEGGHYIFGKLSGYSLASFRIGTLTFLKENNRIKIKKFNIVGTGGQCLMTPPDWNDSNFPYLLYNLGGVIVNVVFGVLCLLLNLLVSKIPILSAFLFMNFIFGIGSALMNGIPLKMGGITNDGYNAISLYKDSTIRYTFWIQLKMFGLLSNGIRLKDMPKEWFCLPNNADLNNPLICSIGVLECNYLHDKHEFEKAKTSCEFMIYEAPGTLQLHKNELNCELMFYEIIGQCRKEEIDKIYTKELQKYIKATSSYISRKRLMYAYELLVNKNYVNAQNELATFEKVAKTYPYQGEIKSERELIEIIKAHSVI